MQDKLRKNLNTAIAVGLLGIITGCDPQVESKNTPKPMKENTVQQIKEEKTLGLATYYHFRDFLEGKIGTTTYLFGGERVQTIEERIGEERKQFQGKEVLVIKKRCTRQISDEPGQRSYVYVEVPGYVVDDIPRDTKGMLCKETGRKTIITHVPIHDRPGLEYTLKKEGYNHIEIWHETQFMKQSD